MFVSLSIFLQLSMCLPSFSLSPIIITTSSTFPHYYRDMFKINFQLMESSKFHHIYLVVKDGLLINEKIPIDFKSKNWYKSSGMSYFDTLSLVNQNQLQIKFKKLSILKIFEIYFKLSESNKLTSTNQIYRHVIDLQIDPKIEMKSTNKFSSIGKLFGQYVEIECHAYDGFPTNELIYYVMNSEGHIENGIGIISKRVFQQQRRNSEFVETVLKVTLMVSQSDDSKYFVCENNKQKKNVKLEFKSHSTKIKIASSGKVKNVYHNGDSLSCEMIGGQRNHANILWDIDETQSNWLIRKRDKLIIENAPDWSVWHVACSGYSTIGVSRQFLSTTKSFIIHPKNDVEPLSGGEFMRYDIISREMINMKKTLETYEMKLFELLAQTNDMRFEEVNFMEITTLVGPSNQQIKMTNKISCAQKANKYGIVGYQYKDSICSLYNYFGPCDANFEPKIQSINLRRKEWNKIGPVVSHPYNIIFFGVKSFFIDFHKHNARIILDNTKLVIIAVSLDTKAILAISTESDVRVVASGYFKMQDEIFGSSNSKQQYPFYSNLAKWLTNNRCDRIKSCSFHISDYMKYLSKTGVILVVPSDFSKMVSNRIYDKIDNGEWGVIFIGHNINKNARDEGYYNKYNEMTKRYGFIMEKLSMSRNVEVPININPVFCTKS